MISGQWSFSIFFPSIERHVQKHRSYLDRNFYDEDVGGLKYPSEPGS